MMADATGQITAERWQEIKAIVADALEEKSATARVALIRARCGSDAGLLSEVESLLEQTTGSLESFAESATESLRQKMSIFAPGRRVGAYAIVRELGRGGMGAVYLASRADGAFEKQVAVKVLKRGTDTDEVLRRFRSEREILARLDHPNIARLLDAGTTDDGLPYFVMDYVDGKPITKYADEKRLSLTERLKLFRIVCSAVSYAHQNLVIHRDIKPSNVFVTNDGEVKLLDFGIAKVVQEAESEHQVTATMLRVLTPEYASPEQIKGERVTTVSDVYSLGVFLYELLTGSRPYKLKTRSAGELTKAICEQEPERPSTAITRSTSNILDLTPRQLRGDLDNIVLKALCKEPERRYVSVDQFSADIRRHLEGLPVRARKDTAAYRASKFIRRHKLAVSAAAAVLIVLVAGIVTTTLEARAAQTQRANAERRFNDVRRIANSFMFEIHNSIKDLPGSLAARQLIMQRALEYLDSLVHEARDDLSLMSELALAYDKIGRVTFNVQQAIASHRKAVSLNEALVKAAPKNSTYKKQLSDSYDDLADVLKIAGNSSGAIQYARRALEVMQPLAKEHSADKEMQAALADRYISLGIALNDAGYFKEALDVDLAGLSTEQQLDAQNPSDMEVRRILAEFYGNVSDAYEDLGDYSNALDYGRKQMEITSQIFQSDPASARYRRDMWAGYFRAGRQLAVTGSTTGAAENNSKAIELMEALATADPNDTGHRRWLALTYFSAGDLLASTNQSDKARELYRKAVAMDEGLLTADPDRVEVRRDLARMHWATGRLLGKLGQTSRAVEELDKAAALGNALANEDPNNLRVHGRLAEISADLGAGYQKLAEQSDESLKARRANLHKARDSYQRSLDLWQELKSKSALRGIDAAKLDEVVNEIAKCDAALNR